MWGVNVMNILIDYKTIKKIARRLKAEVLDADKSAGSFKQSLKSKTAAQFIFNKYNGGFTLEDVERLQRSSYCKEITENGKAQKIYTIWSKWNK